MKSITYLKFSIVSILLSLIMVGCTDEYELPSSGSTGGDGETEYDEVTAWMDGVLSYYYLYNEEYNELSRDLTLSYSSFLNTTLTQMTTNVLDYKDGSIYSYITRAASTKSATRLSTSKYKELSLGFAVVGTITYSNTERVGLAIYAVTDGSPLYEAGARRGDCILQVNDVTLTMSNVYSYATALLSPSEGETYKLLMDDAQTLSVTAEYIYCSPILKHDIYEVGSTKVGYISYLSFDAAYDDDLLDVIADFKANGVTEMILDMRFNGGGYVDTSNKLTTAIAGQASENKIFTNYTYNPSRGTSVVGFKSGLSDYYLNLDRLYCVVSGYTASASELVVNALAGIDIEVILIGDTTKGKNVAMEVFTKTYDGWDYTFAPITIALSNAKGEGDYSSGFVPDYPRDDWYNGYNFADFDENEVMIWTALDLISGGTGVSEVSSTRISDLGESKIKGEIEMPGNIKGGNLLYVE